jgi:PhzF family phenazine biosynthesis protein
MTTRSRSFAQVDVFSSVPYLGNPVAVVVDADGITDEEMARFARWTNLSETTFVQSATSPDADYRLRIFTPGGEIPFAGHPTLGSAHAWLEAGGLPATAGVIVQECGAGLVPIRRAATSLAFRAPEPTRTGPLDEEQLARAARALGVDRARIVGHQWVDNGPGWAAVQLSTAADVLALTPDDTLMADLMLGVVGTHPEGSPEQFELRAFAAPVGVREDPVTGSLNASVAQWLIGTGAAPASYVASQGTVLGRRGKITVNAIDGDVWVGGACTTCVSGTVLL